MVERMGDEVDLPRLWRQYQSFRSFAYPSTSTVAADIRGGELRCRIAVGSARRFDSDDCVC